MKHLFLPLLSTLLSGCLSMTQPQSLGEKESGYTYVPIDPFSVQTIPGDSCKESSTPQVKFSTPQAKQSLILLSSLPDNAVRMLIERFNASGSVTYGPSKFGTKGEAYRVTVDYINADTINFPVWISKKVRSFDGEVKSVSLSATPHQFTFIPDSEIYVVTRDKPTPELISEFVEFNIPVYIGIGLRVSATVDVIGNSANISGIGVIGAEAEAERLRGSLVVQTLGVNGKSVSAALPIQSELNRTTAQNAIVAVGSIKALLYADETALSPRVVGIYLPFPGGKPLVNAIISELSRKRVQWPKPCLIASQ